MKIIYKGHELEVKREKCMAGYDMLYYSAYRVRDGYGAIDSYTSDDSPVRVFIKYVKDMLDESIKTVRDRYPSGKCPCGKVIPEDATEDSDCDCGHTFCVDSDSLD